MLHIELFEFSQSHFEVCLRRHLKMRYLSVEPLVEETIHEHMATVQRSTLELSDLVNIISVW